MTAGRHSRNYAGGAIMAAERWKLNTLVARFPVSWQSRLRQRLGREQTWENLRRWREAVSKLVDAERGGLRPDASDDEICTQADVTARDMHRRLGLVAAVVRARERGSNVALRLQAFVARRLLARRGMLDVWLWDKPEHRAGAVARMSCPLFWRRAYRKLHARTVEAVEIQIGNVRQGRGVYASDNAVTRSRAADVRNAAALESVIAVNDHHQAYTLAELAAKGVANQEIRRHELLTRIAGFELIAKDMGHWAVMVTTTCASRFHAATTRKDGRVVDNRKWERLTPRDGQQNLSKKWARCRAAAARAGMVWYGFRIAEPQHDGTPHWHLLLFVAGGTFAQLEYFFRRYFLACDMPDEPGAQQHRLQFELIDWAKGSAVGYVIKYVSKNIDGHGVGQDLFGEDAITSSQRVRAWARTWRIRQFQQIGGPPVGVWRELRRVHPDNVPDTAPEPLREAIVAMNVAKTEPGVQSAAWRRYTLAQGGVGTCRKAMRIKLIKEATGQKTRYGEDAADRPVGVVALGVELFRNHIHEMLRDHQPFERRVTMEVESERAQWLMGGRSKGAALAVAAVVFERSAAGASTRIHVNNCTRPPAPPSEFAPVVRRMRKLRVFRRFEAAPGRSPGMQQE